MDVVSYYELFLIICLPFRLGLFVKPLYKALYDLDQAEAKRIYKSHRSFYHYAIQHNFDGLLMN